MVFRLLFLCGIGQIKEKLFQEPTATANKIGENMSAKSKSDVGGLYDLLIERFVKWADDCPDIRVALIVGSRARSDHPADEWADLDIIMVTIDPQLHLSSTDWLKNIGNPLLTFLEPTATGDELERRVLFGGMLNVDFSIIPKGKAEQVLRSEVSPEIANTFGRGVRVLVDKDNIASELRKLVSTVKRAPSRLPTENEFVEVVNDFLYHAIFTAKHLRRGELWWTVTCLDCYMQRLMLRMTESHAKAVYGLNHETWFRGRFLEEWAKPSVLKRLQSSFAHYDKEDIKHALLATMSLFQEMVKETSGRLGFKYAAEVDMKIMEWIKTCISEKE
jgi:aminoglycoside 6-adenylyltransferase